MEKANFDFFTPEAKLNKVHWNTSRLLTNILKSLKIMINYS